jgi:hypothetical protein
MFGEAILQTSKFYNLFIHYPNNNNKKNSGYKLCRARKETTDLLIAPLVVLLVLFSVIYPIYWVDALNADCLEIVGILVARLQSIYIWKCTLPWRLCDCRVSSHVHRNSRVWHACWVVSVSLYPCKNVSTKCGSCVRRATSSTDWAVNMGQCCPSFAIVWLNDKVTVPFALQVIDKLL